MEIVHLKLYVSYLGHGGSSCWRSSFYRDSHDDYDDQTYSQLWYYHACLNCVSFSSNYKG